MQQACNQNCPTICLIVEINSSSLLQLCLPWHRCVLWSHSVHALSLRAKSIPPTSSIPLTNEHLVTDDNIHNWRWQLCKTYCFSTHRSGKSFKQFPFIASQSQSLVLIQLQRFHTYLRSYLPQSQRLRVYHT